MATFPFNVDFQEANAQVDPSNQHLGEEKGATIVPVQNSRVSWFFFPEVFQGIMTVIVGTLDFTVSEHLASFNFP